MLKTMWMQFWNKLSGKERKVVTGLGAGLTLVLVLLVVGQLTKPKPDALSEQYLDATRQAGKALQNAAPKPAQ